MSTLGLSKATTTTLGSVLFLAGWIAVIITAAMYFTPCDSKDASATNEPKFDDTWGFAILLTGVTVILFATLAKISGDRYWYFPTTHPSPSLNWITMRPLISVGLFFAAWYAFAISISFKSGSWDSGKFIVGMVAATLMALSEPLLKKNRIAGLSSDSPLANLHVYNIRLPLFVAAWMLVALEISMEDNCSAD